MRVKCREVKFTCSNKEKVLTEESKNGGICKEEGEGNFHLTFKIIVFIFYIFYLLFHIFGIINRERDECPPSSHSHSQHFFSLLSSPFP